MMKLTLNLFVFSLVSYVSSEVIFCYYGSWAVYRPPGGRVDVTDLDASLCTHVVYSFMGISADGGVSLLDPYRDVDLKGLEKFRKLKEVNPDVKLLVSIGGWSQGPKNFSKVANNPVLLGRFADNAKNFVKKYKLDGVDIDWEFPTSTDKVALVRMVKAVRESLKEGEFILTAAVSVCKERREIVYDVAGLTRYVNYIHLMAYDFHTHLDSKTGHNTPLFPSTRESNKLLNVDAVIRDWIHAGGDPKKLVLGIGLYGRSFTLKNASNTDVGAETIGAGIPGKFIKDAGSLSYAEICQNLKNGWVEHWDDEQQVPYAFKGNQWVSYDNQKSIDLKCDTVKKYKLAGVKIWSMDQDDVYGSCSKTKYPLLSVIKKRMTVSMGPRPTPHSNPTQTKTPFTPIVLRPQEKDFKCSKVGFVRSPTRCDVFYYCAPDKSYTTYSCHSGEYYDEKAGACNLASTVKC